MILKFRELEVIWAVLNEGSVSRAASRLSVTQPAVSMMLRQARSRLGFDLFERRGTRLVATRQLSELAPALSSVFTTIADVSAKVLEIRDGQFGMLRIAATSALSEAFVTNALTDFQVHHPKIKASLESLTNLGVIEGVEAGRFDVGITVSKTRLAGGISRVLGMTEIVCVMRSDDPLCALSVVTVADLADRRLVSYRPETIFGGKLRSCFEEQGQVFAPAVETNAVNTSALVSQGLGVGLIDGLVFKRNRDPSLRVRPFIPRISSALYMVRSGTGPNSAADLFEQAVLLALDKVR